MLSFSISNMLNNEYKGWKKLRGYAWLMYVHVYVGGVVGFLVCRDQS